MDNPAIRKLKKELKIHAHAVGIPEGSAKIFVDETVSQVKAKLATQTTITNQDLTRLISKELSKYNSDLAYVYKNHDKII